LYSPGRSEFSGTFTGLEWLSPEIHWLLVWTYSKNHRAVLDFHGDPPGWNLPNVKLHRAVLDLIKVHRAVMNLIAESPAVVV
jgi:hypothetical protein